MTKEELRTKYERIHFTESDNKKGKLKQGYARWLESELLEAINHSRCCKSDSEQFTPNDVNLPKENKPISMHTDSKKPLTKKV
jgi:hypothetical protein